MSAVEFRPSRVRRISTQEWGAAIEAETPPLPWSGPQGQRIFSFMLAPVPECPSRTTVVFLDAFGKPVAVLDDGPMAHMVRSLDPVLGELTFLPDLID
jgi:hypothetical protein